MQRALIFFLLLFLAPLVPRPALGVEADHYCYTAPGWVPCNGPGVVNPALDAVTGTDTGTLAASTTLTRQVLWVHVIYTADATVGNRWIVLALKNASGTIVGDWHAGAAITASQADQHIEFLPGIYRETSFINSTIQVPFPAALTIPIGYTLTISDSSAVSASDSFTAYIATVGQ